MCGEGGGASIQNQFAKIRNLTNLLTDAQTLAKLVLRSDRYANVYEMVSLKSKMMTALFSSCYMGIEESSRKVTYRLVGIAETLRIFMSSMSHVGFTALKQCGLHVGSFFKNTFG